MSPTYRLLDHLLPHGVAYFVGARRGTGASWRAIAREIQEATGVIVSHETLRLWFPSDADGNHDADEAA